MSRRARWETRGRQQAWVGAVSLATLLVTSGALGQTAGPRAAAPEEAGPAQPANPALAGLAAYDAGDYQRAAELLTTALKDFPLPTVAYYAARAHVELGLLTEAAELYQQATALPPTGTGAKLKTQQEAQESARAELGALRPRIPQLTVRVQSLAPEAVSVALDGTALPRSALGRPLPINPGRHELAGRCDTQPLVLREVSLAEGAREDVKLEVPCAAPSPEQTAPSSKQLVPTLGWTAVGVGSAAWGAWVVTGLVARNKLSNLEDEGTCDANHSCERDSAGDLDPYRSLRTASAVGFWAGGTLLAAGVGTLVWHRSRKRERASRIEVTPWVSPVSVQVRGRF